MSYSFYSDAELRNLLFVDPSNAVAVAEATRRFCHPRVTDDDLQKVQEILDEMESSAEDCEPELDHTFSPESVLDWARNLKEALHVD